MLVKKPVSLTKVDLKNVGKNYPIWFIYLFSLFLGPGCPDN